MAARNIRSWDDVEKACAAGKLSDAEWELVEHCKAGTVCKLGDDVPMAPSDARNIGADLLRYLITGGCDKAGLHEVGVQLRGAYISDPLRLDMCRAVGKTSLDSCYFAERLNTESTEFQLLDLDGSHFPKGIWAQATEVTSNAFLRGITAKATVDLNSAEIGGALTCENAQLLCEEGKTLNAQGAKIRGSVFLTEIIAKATVDLNSTEIGGQLACENAKLLCEEGKALNAQGAKIKDSVFLWGTIAKATVALNRTKIGGQLSFRGANLNAKEGTALHLQDMRANSLYWTDIAACDGRVVLTSAQVDDLVDDTDSWAKVSAVDLDRFTYGHLQNPLTVEDRLEWLAKDKETAGVFQPQPYQQLAKVYGEMGHDADRRRVLVTKERLQRKEPRDQLRAQRRFLRNIKRFSARPNEQRNSELLETLRDSQYLEANLVKKTFERFKIFHLAPQNDALDDYTLELAQRDFRQELRNKIFKIRLNLVWRQTTNAIFRWLAGFGYQPFNAVWSLFFLIALGTFVSWKAWDTGDFAPNSDVILSTTEWQDLAEDPSITNPAKRWSDEYSKGRDYETFSSFAYAIDVVVPIVSIGQEAAWAPSTNREIWGKILWRLRWVLTILGWIVTAVGAAAITGVIRRE